MSLIDTLIHKIKEEIALDPEGVGYAGKTDEEIAVLLNSGYTKQRVVEDGFPPPISRILAGIPSMPNQVAVSEVTAAKQVISAEKDGKTVTIEDKITVTEGGVG